MLVRCLKLVVNLRFAGIPSIQLFRLYKLLFLCLNDDLFLLLFLNLSFFMNLSFKSNNFPFVTSFCGYFLPEWLNATSLTSLSSDTLPPQIHLTPYVILKLNRKLTPSYFTNLRSIYVNCSYISPP